VVAGVPGVKLEIHGNGGDRRSYRVSFDRIRSVLGFEATRTIDDAINEVNDLLRSGGVSDFRDDRYHNAKWLSANGHRQQGAA
jgi:hypothetical protein